MNKTILTSAMLLGLGLSTAELWCPPKIDPMAQQRADYKTFYKRKLPALYENFYILSPNDPNFASKEKEIEDIRRDFIRNGGTKRDLTKIVRRARQTVQLQIAATLKEKDSAFSKARHRNEKRRILSEINELTALLQNVYDNTQPNHSNVDATIDDLQLQNICFEPR